MGKVFCFMGGDNMKDKLADFLVLFRRGEVTGIHNEREVELKEICNSLGGLDCKVFDPYMVYSNLADNGLLVRVETKNLDGSWSILFYYPVEKIKTMLEEKLSTLYWTRLDTITSY